MQTDMTVGKPMKMILDFTIPVFIGNVFQQFYNMADAIIVGKFVGTKGLAAVGSTGTIMFLIIGFLMGLTAGFTVLTSQKFGAGKMDEMRQSVGNAALLSIIISVIMTAVSMVGMHSLLTLMHTPEDIFQDAYTYIMIICGGIFAQVLYNILASILRALGNSKVPLYFLILSAMLNIVLDPIFIYVFGMGVKGAALATIISQGVSCLWVLKFLTGKKTILKIRLKNLVLDGKIVTSVLSLGVSPFIMQATECLIQLTFNNGMLKYGNDLYVALMSILFSLTQLIWMPLNGFSQGAQPVIGYNYGAKRFDRVKKAFKLQFTVSICFSLFAVALVEVFPTAFLKMFTNDQELIDIGINSTRLFLAGMSVMGAQCACQQTFLALGEAKISMFLACLRKIILLFPLALILPNIANMGVWGLLLAEPVSDVVAASCTTIMFTIRSRKILKQ